MSDQEPETYEVKLTITVNAICPEDARDEAYEEILESPYIKNKLKVFKNNEEEVLIW